MRTTIREKLILWINGLALAVCLELLLRAQASPISLQGLAVITPTLAVMAAVTLILLRRT